MERKDLRQTSEDSKRKKRKRSNWKKSPNMLMEPGDILHYFVSSTMGSLHVTKIPLHNGDETIWTVGVHAQIEKKAFSASAVHTLSKEAKKAAMVKVLQSYIEFWPHTAEYWGWLVKTVHNLRLRLFEAKKKKRRESGERNREKRRRERPSGFSPFILSLYEDEPTEEPQAPEAEQTQAETAYAEELARASEREKEAVKKLEWILWTKMSQYTAEEKLKQKTQEDRDSRARRELLEMGYTEVVMNGYSFWMDTEGRYRWYQEGASSTLRYIPMMSSTEGNLLFLDTSGKILGFMCKLCREPICKPGQIVKTKKRTYRYGEVCWQIPHETKFVCRGCSFKLSNLHYNPAVLDERRVPGLARTTVDELLRSAVRDVPLELKGVTMVENPATIEPVIVRSALELSQAEDRGAGGLDHWAKERRDRPI